MQNLKPAAWEGIHRALNWHLSLSWSSFTPHHVECRPAVLASQCPQKKNSALDSCHWNLKPQRANRKENTETLTRNHVENKFDTEITYLQPLLKSSVNFIREPVMTWPRIYLSYISTSFVHLPPFQQKRTRQPFAQDFTEITEP